MKPTVFLSLLLLCLMLPRPLPAEAVAASTLQARQRALSQKLHYHRARAHYLKQKEAKEVQELTTLQQKLEQTATELQDSQFRLRRAEHRLTLTQAQLAQARRDFARQKRATEIRLRAIYKNKALDQWEALLSAKDMTTFLTRYHYFKRISAHDARLLEDLDKKRLLIRNQQSQYAQQTQSIARITQAIGTQKHQLAGLTTEQASIVNRVKTDRQAAEQAVAQLEADSRQIEAMIRRFLAEQRRRRGVRRPPLGTGRFAVPVAGVVTSGFGMRHHPILNRAVGHHGIDFGAYMNTPIYAADSGEVISAGWYGGYGKMIIIDHGGDLMTLYGHTNAYVVRSGQRVKKGQLIGYVGSTGQSTGPHLHFEVRRNGTPVNPMGYLR